MHQNKITILCTRPIDEQLIRDAADQNIFIEVIPFIETEPVNNPGVNDQIDSALGETATIVFTSMNAVAAVAAHLHKRVPLWKIYCIGNTTKKLAETYFGSMSITATAKDARELAKKLIEDNIKSEVIFFCGDKRREDLPALLKQRSIEVNEIEVYRTTMLAHKIDKQYKGILFFSPSAVESFFSNNSLDKETILFAIGNTTANEINNYSGNTIVTSSEPDKKKLLETAIQFFKANRVHH